MSSTKYMELHNQVAGMVCRNMCAKYGLEAPRSKWKALRRGLRLTVLKLLWRFQTQTDKMVMVNQPEIVVWDKQEIKGYMNVRRGNA